MKKIAILIISLLFFSDSALPQNDTMIVTVKGSVVNQKDRKLEGVNVSAMNKSTQDVYSGKNR
ncbi:MAG: hypothetical protein AB2L26_03515 [Ignavibacteria bacterium]